MQITPSSLYIWWSDTHHHRGWSVSQILFGLHMIKMTYDPITLQYNAGFRLACRFAAWSSLAVSELQLSAATPLWLYHRAASLPSWIEFNCLRSAAVGKAARLSICWLDAACCVVIPLRQVALAQLNKYHHQSGNAASGKLVWNQHKSTILLNSSHLMFMCLCNVH